MTREPLKPGQKVWVKKHIDRPLAGTVMFGRPRATGCGGGGPVQDSGRKLGITLPLRKDGK